MTADENNLTEMLNTFIKNKNKMEFLSSYSNFIYSFYEKLKKDGKTDEEIRQEFYKICYDVGYNIGSNMKYTSQVDMIKDVLASGLLNFIIQYKYNNKLYI